MFIQSLVGGVVSLAALSEGVVLHSRGPVCSDIIIPVSIRTENLALPTTFSVTDLETVVATLGSNLFNLGTNILDKTYQIGATYCEPEVQNATRANTIQLLVHGITYDRHYWDGLSNLEVTRYSWRDFASKQGYPTLSIDRLGSGLSSHPDGILEVQFPAAVEVTHSIIQTLKSGGIGGKQFNTIIYVGHSYGSMIGNSHSAKYPDDCASYIFTGWTDQVKPSIPYIALQALLIPAAVARPAAYGGFPASYLTLGTKSGFDSLFFTKSTSSSALRQLNYDTRGTITLGELATAVFSDNVAVNYVGAVFVLTGEKDVVFCSADSLGVGLPIGALFGQGDCGMGVDSKVSRSRSLYPNARNFGFEVVVGVGHCNGLHFGAVGQFERVHRWLEGVGF